MIFIKIDGDDQHLFQWDKGQRLIIYDVDGTYCAEFAFYGDKKCTPAEIYEDGGASYCDIPDSVLTRCGQLICYIRKINEDKEETVKYARFTVKPKPKPDDYVEPDEILVWHDLENRIKAIEEIDLSAFATREYVDKKVSELTGNSGNTSFDETYEGRLLYVVDGTLVPLGLGPGLEIRNGVLYITGGGGGDVETGITVETDDSGVFRVYADGVEILPTVDEDGVISWPGVKLSVDEHGTLIFEEAK